MIIDCVSPGKDVLFPPAIGIISCRKNKKMEVSMTKAELIDKMAKDADISRAAAGKALDALIDGVKKTLKKGGRVALVGFGAFSVSKRKARKGRNPQTGAVINIKASKAPKFTAGKGFKEAVR
jgi:DNA-binding protein HU-beta